MRFMIPLSLMWLFAGSVSACRADFLEYIIPVKAGALKVVLEGRVHNNGTNVTLAHPKFGRLVFGRRMCILHEVPTLREQVGRALSVAARKRDAKEMLRLAEPLLRRAMISDYNKVIDAVLEIEPENEVALRVQRLRERMDAPIPESKEVETELQRLVPLSRMKIQRSDHFILLHDTPGRQSRDEPPRADERLALLEQVYETFLLFFTVHGVDLEVPQERLRVVLFNEKRDFHEFGDRLSPELRSALGFYSPDTNTSFFFDHASDEDFVALQELSKELDRHVKELNRLRVPNRAEPIRVAKLIQALVKIEQEESDVTVVSHEATHQLAANTGLFPRHVLVPTWVHEGLATFFETPRSASWSGIGAVSEERLEWYRALEGDRDHSQIEFIVGDEIFDLAATHDGTLHAYGQSWALTHFLVNRHFDRLMAYYRMLAALPADLRFSPQIHNQIFNRAFPPAERKDLDLQWRVYMRNLKTDFEVAKSSRR